MEMWHLTSLVIPEFVLNSTVLSCLLRRTFSRVGSSGNKKVFLCWVNIYITNIKCFGLVTNICVCERRFSERVGHKAPRLSYPVACIH